MEAFTGKTVIVTGGASGIGFALAKAFLEHGANVMVADIERAALDQSLSQLRNYGNRVRGVVCDVSQRSSIAAAKQETIGSFGRVHILCNNAGVASGGLIEEISDADWQWVIGVNFMGIVHGVSEFVPYFKSHEERCHIVNTASIAGFYPMPYVAPYSATKFAVVGLSENLALELEGTNIGVSVLCPSMVRTRIHESQRNNPTGPAMSERWKARLDQIGAAVQAGIEPEIVAARALDAIRRKQFYIFTHPESRAKIEGRIQTILNSF